MKKTLITATMSATGSAVMELMDGIGQYEYTLKQWSAAYAGVATASAITLRINSGGGDIVEALAIADAIRNAPQQFTAEVYGICGSAATLIALACDRIEMAPSARWMVHEPTFGVRGSIYELRAFLATAEQLRTDIFALYAQHTGKTPEQLMADHPADRYYTAEEALAYGWVSSIMGAAEVKPEETPEPPAPVEPTEKQPAEEMEEDTEPAEEEETPEPPAPEEQPTVEDAPAEDDDEDAPEEPEKPRTTAVTRLLALLGMRSAAQKQFDALSYWQHRARKAEAVAAGHIAHAARRRRDVEAEHAAHLQRVNAEVAARMAALGFSAAALPAPVQAPTPPAAPSLASLAKADGFDAALAAAAARLR